MVMTSCWLCSAAGHGGCGWLSDVEELAAQEPEEHELRQPGLPQNHRGRPEHRHHQTRRQRGPHLPGGEFKCARMLAPPPRLILNLTRKLLCSNPPLISPQRPPTLTPADAAVPHTSSAFAHTDYTDYHNPSQSHKMETSPPHTHIHWLKSSAVSEPTNHWAAAECPLGVFLLWSHGLHFFCKNSIVQLLAMFTIHCVRNQWPTV